MGVAVAAVTDVGRVRERNEDHAVVDGLLVSGANGQHSADIEVPFSVAVLDGLGGHPGGDVASRLAAEVVADTAAPADADDADDLVQRMQDRVFEQMRSAPELGAMGTTVVVASILAGDRALVLGVGDSSAMLCSDGMLHPVVAEDRGPHGWITQCIGGTVDPEPLRPHVREITGPGRLVLCTDGLTDVCSGRHIGHVLRSADTPEAAARELLEDVRSRGAPDNVTVVVLDLSAPT